MALLLCVSFQSVLFGFSQGEERGSSRFCQRRQEMESTDQKWGGWVCHWPYNRLKDVLQFATDYLIKKGLLKNIHVEVNDCAHNLKCCLKKKTMALSSFYQTVQRNDPSPMCSIISGAADTDEALQRRKERYRQELQEQIAEQHRNKKRYSISDLCLFMYSITPK